MQTTLEDLRSPSLWRGSVAELLGTLLLCFAGCGSCLSHDSADWANYTPTVVQISLTFGIAVAVIVWGIAHVSGGHINPAVTIGMLVARKISIVRALIFMFAQCAGAVCGVAILAGLTPAELRGTLGLTTLNGSLTVEQGFGVEFLITFVLVFTVFACCDPCRKDVNGSAPFVIGASVTLCHLFAIKFTGASMNPARTFGPAVLSGIWSHHWVYWCGPLLGGVVAALLYESVFAANASLGKARRFLLSSTYESGSGEYEQVPTVEHKDSQNNSAQLLKGIEAEAVV